MLIIVRIVIRNRIMKIVNSILVMVVVVLDMLWKLRMLVISEMMVKMMVYLSM